MSDYRVSSSAAISIGTTAQTFTADAIENAADASAVRSRVPMAIRVKNTHVSQNLFVRRGATATTSVFDMAVGAGGEATMSLGSAGYVSIIASGATTTGFIEWGGSA